MNKSADPNYTKDILDNIADIIAFYPQKIRKNIRIALVQVWQDRHKNTERTIIYKQLQYARLCLSSSPFVRSLSTVLASLYLHRNLNNLN